MLISLVSECLHLLYFPFPSLREVSVLCELQPGYPGNSASYTAAVITKVKGRGETIYTSFITLSPFHERKNVNLYITIEWGRLL